MENGTSIKPLVEIISNPTTADIPFAGLTFTGTAATEKEPFVIALADNSLVVLHILNNDIQFTYTDTAGTVFTPVTITVNAVIHGLACCQLTSGNIGITYFINSGGNYSLIYRIVTPLGVAVSTATIATWANTVFTSHTWVITRGANDYLLIYAKASGSNYYIYKRTSANFTSWSAESALSIAGFTATHKLDNPSLLLLSTGELQLWVDYATSIDSTGHELSNIYMSSSSDNGTTWGTATAITDYTLYSVVGRHPVAVETANTSAIKMLFREVRTLMEYRGGAQLVYIQYNPLNSTVLLMFSNKKVTVLNILTWAVVDEWTTATIPAISDSTLASHNFVPGPTLAALVADTYFIDVLDTASDTIKQYNFVTIGARTKNVSFSGNMTDYLPTSHKNCYIDEANMKLWITFVDGWGMGGNTITMQIGYIDLTDPGPAYTCTIMVTQLNPPCGTGRLINTAYYPDLDIVIAYRNLEYPSGTYSPMCRVYNISTNSLIKNYNKEDFSTFPVNGIHKLIMYDNCLYGFFDYSSALGEVDRRGLVKISLANDAISYHRPTWASIDEYAFQDIIPGATGQLIITNYAYGVTVYTIADDSWTLFNNDNVPGLLPNGTSGVNYLAYDAVHDYIFVSSYYGSGYNLLMFPGSGTLKNANYYTGLYTTGWDFTFQGRLILNNNEYDAVAVADPLQPTSMVTFWQTGDYDIKWAKDGSSLNISDYLLNDSEISIERSISGNPHQLRFSCSDGHLFDYHNINSALRGTFAKGRKLVVRWGLNIDGLDTWTAAGTFYVTETNVVYQRGVYSDISISAEDMRSIWANKQIWATDYYDNYPELIIAHLAETFAGIDPTDISLPVFVNRVVLEHQWIETPLEKILTQICDRFGYFLKINPDNTLSAGLISDSSAVDHTYSDSAEIISFQPDDKFSDFTNRVTVLGQEKTYIEVSYPEERIATKSGTVGWYGFHNDYHIPYSEDESRTCVNPRLHVVESVTSIGFKLTGSISERISYTDPNNKYCTLTVEAPDLSPLLITSLASLIGSQYAPDFVSSGGGSTIRVGSRLTAFFTWTSLMIIAASGNFQYEIWATPKGRIRRSIQSSADDLESQQAMGVVVDRKLEDPLCYSVNECQFVADNELLVARLQRQRVKISKVARIGDEEGHTIQLNHPYSGAPMKIFITDLKRSYTKPSQEGSDGGFFDEIEGWVL